MRNALLVHAAAILAAASVLAGGGKATAGPEEGFVSFGFGGLTVTAISDSTGSMPRSLFFDITPGDFASFARAGRSPSESSLPSWINAFLVEKGDQLFLVDAGTGPEILKRVAAAGYSPERVTHVLVTHFHGDHIGGLVDAEGRAAFPAAELWAPLRDEEYFLPQSDPEVSGAELARKVTAPYREAGRYRAFEPGGQIAPGVKSSSLWGHTPGHTGFAFETSEGPFLAWGDIVHAYLIQFARPEVTLAYDVDRQAAAETRRRILNEAADGRWLVAGAHLPFPGLGRVERKDGAFAWKPYSATAPGGAVDGPGEGPAPEPEPEPQP